MKHKATASELITEHIFEIQHGASGKMLDIKGALADTIRVSGMFPDWQLDLNGIKFFDAKLAVKEKDAIVNYNLIRFSTYNPSTKNYFEDQVEKFIKTIQRSNLYTVPEVKRFGVRTKCFVPCNLEFEEINRKIFSLFYKEKTIDLLGIQKDFQVVIEIRENDFQVKICLGPVKPNEVNKFYGFKLEKFNNVGVYIDIDCYQEKKIDYKATKNLIDSAMKITWDKISILLSTIEV